MLIALKKGIKLPARQPITGERIVMTNRAFVVLSALLAAFAFALAPSFALADEDATSHAVLLVAQPELSDPLYSSTVLIARPTPEGGHIGFIINKPTTAQLGDVFPEHAPSKKVIDPLFLGGPAGLDTVFALVERHGKQKDGAMQIMPDLFLAVQDKDVDRVIETESDHARFFVGIVVWKPGELDQEMQRGLWYALEPDAKLILRKNTENLWDELVRKGEDRAHSI
jgi:putative transcriptional regulator